MSVQRSPIVSEFETRELADSHDGWFRRKVEESLADARGGVAHDQVMADVEAVTSEAQARGAVVDAAHRLASHRQGRFLADHSLHRQ